MINHLTMQESEPLIYNSEFLPNIQIAIVFEENPQYKDLKPLFDEYGYGFMVPGKNLVIIDGEQFIDNFNADVLKFVEAHEISHIIMGHDGPRSDDDEMDADLGAYILLKKSGKTDSIKTLLKQFRNRHGVRFNENLLDRVKKYFQS
jgi:Zn-dependent peptidase ImmA (M78 family)|tara:strand:+ start:5510 stop:5950 length:441 start_codon:yes stop_codon:yes gene_type:complete